MYTNKDKSYTLRVTYLSSLSWKKRKLNDGYWKMVWKTCNKKGCHWQPRLRWQTI